MRVYAQRVVCDLAGPLHQPLPARLEQTLEFQFGEQLEVSNGKKRQVSWSGSVVGSFTDGAYMLTLKNRVISFAIFFHPVGLSRLFCVPPVELANCAFEARTVLPSAVDLLYRQLAACTSFDARVITAETFLRSRVAGGTGQETIAIHAATRIFGLKGVVRMDELARHYGLGLRQFERIVKGYLGVAPKKYARVARFQTALDVKLGRPKRSWLDIAHDLGYHDHMHMVRDFHDLAGAAPSELLKAIGDARPPAMQMADHDTLSIVS